MYSEMIYKHGFIHCDPHPGNILVSNNTNRSGKNSAQITLLDHGLYQQLTDDFRLLYCRLWNALILKDNDSIKRYCQELEAGELYPLLACIITARTWDSIQVGIGSLERTSSEVSDSLLLHYNYNGIKLYTFWISSIIPLSHLYINQS